MTLENIISLVKGQVAHTVASDTDIPAEKKDATVEATTSSLMDGLKQYLTPANMASLASMFGNGTPSSSAHTSGALAQGLQSGVVSNLISKVGLSQGSAQKLAAGVIPAVIALFSKKLNDSGDSGLNIGSLVNAFTGQQSDDHHGEGIMDTIGNIFGNK